MKHCLVPSGRWAIWHPVVVGTRGAVNSSYLAYAWPKEVDEIAVEAWERMTDGGVQGGKGVHSLGQNKYMARDDYRWVSQRVPATGFPTLLDNWSVYLVVH